LQTCNECEVWEQFGDVGLTTAVVMPLFISFTNLFHISLSDQYSQS